MLSLMSLAVLITLALAHPDACRRNAPWLCPAPQVVVPPAGPAVPSIRRGAQADGHLELYVETITAPAWVLPQSPSTYTTATLPEGVSGTGVAPLADRPSAADAYTLVLDVRNLEQSRGISLDELLISVDNLPSVPAPLAVWHPSNQGSYTAAPYRAHYAGDAAGTHLTAVYVGQPSFVRPLDPGESDTLDITIASVLPVALTYHVTVLYHVLGDTTAHVLNWTTHYTVIFLAPAQWQVWQLAGGGLVPASTP